MLRLILSLVLVLGLVVPAAMGGNDGPFPMREAEGVWTSPNGLTKLILRRVKLYENNTPTPDDDTALVLVELEDIDSLQTLAVGATLQPAAKKDLRLELNNGTTQSKLNVVVNAVYPKNRTSSDDFTLKIAVTPVGSSGTKRKFELARSITTTDR
jgi:hypothetical protein